MRFYPLWAVVLLEIKYLLYFAILTQHKLIILKNSLIIHEENTKKSHKRVVSVLYVIQIHVDLHKL